MLTTIRNLRIEHAGQSLSVTVSVGIGELQRGESGEEFVARVDRALYEAKRTGRDRLVQADPPPPVTLA
jgi:PleD family two-component response regulator